MGGFCDERRSQCSDSADKTQSGPSVFYGLSVLEDGERGNAEWLVIM